MGITSGTLHALRLVPLIYGLPPIHHISLKAYWLALAASGFFCTAAYHPAVELGHDPGPRLVVQAGVLLN